MKFFAVIILQASVAVSFAQSTRTIAIVNCNVVDVSAGKTLPGMTVVATGGVIDVVGPARKIASPADAVVVDGTGKFLMPGMTDGHIHFFQSGGLYTRPDALNLTHRVPYEEERAFTFNNTTDYFRRYLAAGITTVADLGGPMTNFLIRDSIGKAALSPQVLVTGPLFSMVSNKALDIGDPPIIKTTTIASADSLFDSMLPFRPDFIKIWYIVTRRLPAEKTLPVVQHVADRTHSAGLTLAVHATELNTASLAIDAGADILVHSVDDEVVTDALIRKMIRNKVSYIPTLTVYQGYMKTFAGRRDHREQDLYLANPFAYGSLSDLESIPEEEWPPFIRAIRKGDGRRIRRARVDSVMSANLRKLSDAGVNIVAGTDAGNIGTMHASSFHHELVAMKNAGMSNAQVLRSATVNSATAFGYNAGLIEKGRNADLVLLAGNPLDDLGHLLAIELVVRNGQLMAPDTLVNESPEMLVQRQVNAYNAKNLDAFLDTYASDVELYDFPNTLRVKGKEAMRKEYGFLNTMPELHCAIVNRIVSGNTVIDHERVKFGDKTINAVAVYEVENGKIRKVTFITK